MTSRQYPITTGSWTPGGQRTFEERISAAKLIGACNTVTVSVDGPQEFSEWKAGQQTEQQKQA